MVEDIKTLFGKGASLSEGGTERQNSALTLREENNEREREKMRRAEKERINGVSKWACPSLDHLGATPMLRACALYGSPCCSL